MADFRQFRTNRTPSAPKIETYSLVRDTAFSGFKLKLNWVQEPEKDVIGFFVYRAKYKKSMVRKNYLISQAALEKLTAIRSFGSKSNILYNKGVFSSNSKVKFQIPDAFRHERVETNQKKLIYSNISFIRVNPSGQYEFTDKNIKFGETYSYTISAFARSGFESIKSIPITVNVEDMEHPDPPKNVIIEPSSMGMGITIIPDIALNDIIGFKIYKRASDNDDLEFLAEIKSDEEITYFLDTQVIPNKTYEYHVYSVDFYNNLSYLSAVQKVIFKNINSIREGIKFPEINIKYDGGELIFSGKKPDDKLVGYSIERKDAFVYEQGFSYKTNIGEPWPNVTFFDTEGNFRFIDKSTRKKRSYRYRISGIDQNGHKRSFVVTPFLKIDKGLDITYQLNDICEDCEDPKILKFDVEILDFKQRPIHAKFKWNYTGDAGKIRLDFGSFTKDVDPLHKEIIVTELNVNKTYYITLSLYDFHGNLIETSKPLVINL